MSARDLALGIIFLTQVVAGTLGNVVLLFHYLSLCLTGYRLKPTDLIVVHLTVANTAIVMSKGVAQTVEAFGVMYFSQVLKCTLLLYIYRVGKSVSVSTICLLSVFQALKISPMNSSWTELKAKLPKYIGLSIFLDWILCVLVHCIFPFYAVSKYRSKNTSKVKDFSYYCSDFGDKIAEALYTALVLFPEFLCFGLMLWASCSMVLTLHKHKQQVQYISRRNVSQESSPETRATQSILVVVCTFVILYIIPSFIYVWVINFSIPSLWFLNGSAVISICFPSLSPFVLMKCNSTASKFWYRFSCFFRST